MERAFPGAVLIAMLLLACPAAGDDAFQWTGFALLRGSSSPDSGPLRHESVSAQMQVGLDYAPSPFFNVHLHLLGRDDDGSRRGNAGIPEAYAELSLRPGGDRVRVRAGAFFLPTSRENVDALWENPYAVTSSALNSWFGEEFRPIGVDASWFGRNLFAGATLFRGNDTFGALPPVRGWTLDDHWTLLGEWVPVDAESFTSISAENDGRLGWSARGGWNRDALLVQLTHIDNRADGEDYGELYNWGTRFDLVAAEFTRGDWTAAAEWGWGPTFLMAGRRRYTDDLTAGYLLVSRSWPRVRATVRVESFGVDGDETQAVTLAGFWTPVPRIRVGAELTSAGGDRRALAEVRYRFH